MAAQTSSFGRLAPLLLHKPLLKNENPRHESNKANTDGGQPRSPQPYTKNYKQLSKAGIRRAGRAHRMAVPCQTASSENKHPGNIRTMQVILRNIHLHIHMCMQEQFFKGHEFEGGRRGVCGRIPRRKLLYLCAQSLSLHKSKHGWEGQQNLFLSHQKVLAAARDNVFHYIPVI